MNNRLQDLKIGEGFEDALCKKLDQANSTTFTAEIEHAAPPKVSSTPYHPSRLAALRSWFTSSPKKNPSHLFNIYKKSDESLRDYIKRFKAERANILGCNDQVAFSAFKKGLPIESDLHRELTIDPSQTLADVYATTECYVLWYDDRLAAKKSNRFSNKNSAKLKSQRDPRAYENFTKFSIPIHHILAQVKDKPWVRRPSLLREDPDKKNAHKYCAFHGGYRHYTNNFLAWKKHIEELAREGHCTEFIAKQTIEHIEDHYTAKKPSQKVIRINTIRADSKETWLTNKEKKRKIKHAIVIPQISSNLLLMEADLPHNYALVISIQITQAMVDRVHADKGSATNILQLGVIQQMGLETKINKSAKPLTGFKGATTIIVGKIDLDVYYLPLISLQTFMIIDEVSLYNDILGRSWIGKINAIIFATHQKIRYPILGGGVGQINSDQAMLSSRVEEKQAKSYYYNEFFENL
ncbi:uncharacterized protein LOC109949629 [Prunus persica]|uniref:uncharacterized protein LOC109949629 n=1 Tax=Prunus persica TaxID=3760 RepID=UPI0009AB5E8D|nr:uncharacterized protein LOC109949629 [Prunus persica]